MENLEKCSRCTDSCLLAKKHWKPLIAVDGTVSYIPCAEDCIRHYRKNPRPAQVIEFHPPPKIIGLPRRYKGKTFADYEVTAENARAVRAAHWLTENKPESGLYIYGGVGTGKTFLASLTAQEYGGEVIFGDMPALLDNIKRTFNGAGSAQEIIDRYDHCDLLILDDIGAGYLTPWNVGMTYQIINNRYNANRPILVTSNYNLDALEAVFGQQDKVTAARIKSRLEEMTHGVFTGNADRRAK